MIVINVRKLQYFFFYAYLALILTPISFLLFSQQPFKALTINSVFY